MARTQKAPAIQGHKLNVVKIKQFVLKRYHQQSGAVTTKEKTPVKYIQASRPSRAQLQLSDK